MKYLSLVLLIFVSSLNAEVYRWTNEQGHIVFSDESRPGAERIEVPVPPSYAPLVVEVEAEPVKKEVVKPEISISSPQQDEALWANDGNVPVVIQLQPALDVKKGQELVVTLDGAVIGEPKTALSFTIPIIERGLHSLSVALVDQYGQTLAISDSITFQLHRPSTK